MGMKPRSKYRIQVSEDQILATPGVRRATHEDLEEECPDYLTRMANAIADIEDQKFLEYVEQTIKELKSG